MALKLKIAAVLLIATLALELLFSYNHVGTRRSDATQRTLNRLAVDLSTLYEQGKQPQGLSEVLNELRASGMLDEERTRRYPGIDRCVDAWGTPLVVIWHDDRVSVHSFGPDCKDGKRSPDSDDLYADVPLPFAVR